jgi:hypothetical protein
MDALASVATTMARDGRRLQVTIPDGTPGLPIVVRTRACRFTFARRAASAISTTAPDPPSQASMKKIRIGNHEMTENSDDRLSIRRHVRALEVAERAYTEVPDESLIGATERGGAQIHPCLRGWLQLERAAGAFGAGLGLEAGRTERPIGHPRGANSAQGTLGERTQVPEVAGKLTPLQRWRPPNMAAAQGCRVDRAPSVGVERGVTQLLSAVSAGARCGRRPPRHEEQIWHASRVAW